MTTTNTDTRTNAARIAAARTELAGVEDSIRTAERKVLRKQVGLPANDLRNLLTKHNENVGGARSSGAAAPQNAPGPGGLI